MDDTALVTDHEQWAGRTLTLICGPPGAGKTTLALTLHPTTLDIGELPPGTPRERSRLFGRLAYRAGRNTNPNLAVTRGAARVTDREHLEGLTRPHRTIILPTPADICHERITKRNRAGVDGRDLDGQHAAVDLWWSAWLADEHARLSTGEGHLEHGACG